MSLKETQRYCNDISNTVANVLDGNIYGNIHDIQSLERINTEIFLYAFA